MHYIFAEAYLSISWVGPAKSLGQSADQTLSPLQDHGTVTVLPSRDEHLNSTL